jgi:hypothetical protein
MIVSSLTCKVKSFFIDFFRYVLLFKGLKETPFLSLLAFRGSLFPLYLTALPIALDVGHQAVYPNSSPPSA